MFRTAIFLQFQTDDGPFLPFNFAVPCEVFYSSDKDKNVLDLVETDADQPAKSDPKMEKYFESFCFENSEEFI